MNGSTDRYYAEMKEILSQGGVTAFSFQPNGQEDHRQLVCAIPDGKTFEHVQYACSGLSEKDRPSLQGESSRYIKLVGKPDQIFSVMRQVCATSPSPKAVTAS